MEGGMAGTQACPGVPKRIEDLDIHDVEAAAPIHKHPGETFGANNWLHDERVGPRTWDLVRMAAPIKGDRCLRPLEVFRDSGVYGVHLALTILSRRLLP